MGNRNIHIGSGNYNENIEGDYIEIRDDEDVIRINKKRNSTQIVQGNSNQVVQQSAQQITNIDKAEGLHIGDTITQISTGSGNNVVQQSMFNNMTIGGDPTLGNVSQVTQSSVVEQQINADILRRKADKAQRKMEKAARKAQKGWNVMQQQAGNKSINIQSGADINVTGAGAFNLGDVTGTLANSITQIVSQATGGAIDMDKLGKKENDTVYLDADNPPKASEYRTMMINIETIADMIKLSATNMPVDATRMERYLVLNEIIERLEKNPDLVKLCKENGDAVGIMLTRKLGDGYGKIISMFTEEVKHI